ncbi:MAG: TetR/AcrR family transcriptional regulator [Mycobacteriales bacterium]
MGNREDLLAGAKRCLLEKGMTRTTARDIAAASGVSLAAIGYHFGSKDALMTAAMMAAIEEWSDELEAALSVDLAPDTPPLERFEAIWTRVIESFTTSRQLWSASYELLLLAEHSPEIRTFMTEAMRLARTGLVKIFLNAGPEVDPDADEAEAIALGGFFYALMSGVLVQYLIDPESAPSARDLARSMRMATIGAGSS